MKKYIRSASDASFTDSTGRSRRVQIDFDDLIRLEQLFDEKLGSDFTNQFMQELKDYQTKIYELLAEVWYIAGDVTESIPSYSEQQKVMDDIDEGRMSIGEVAEKYTLPEIRKTIEDFAKAHGVNISQYVY